MVRKKAEEPASKKKNNADFDFGKMLTEHDEKVSPSENKRKRKLEDLDEETQT